MANSLSIWNAPRFSNFYLLESSVSREAARCGARFRHIRWLPSRYSVNHETFYEAMYVEMSDSTAPDGPGVKNLEGYAQDSSGFAFITKTDVPSIVCVPTVVTGLKCGDLLLQRIS